MTAALRFDPIRLPEKCEQLRKEVRAFLAEEMARGTFNPFKPNREDTDVPEFCRRVGERGWIGMTWPKKYGGQERSFLERYVVTEEMRILFEGLRIVEADELSGAEGRLTIIARHPRELRVEDRPPGTRGRTRPGLDRPT